MTLQKFPSRKFVKLALTIASFAILTSAVGLAQTYSNLDTSSGWWSCGGCAGANGVGPNTPRSLGMASSPSLDGSSLKFSIFPTVRYSNALWYKSVSPTSASHLTYDYYVFFKNTWDPQALEFDIMEGNGGRGRTFGTECKPGARLWKIWGNHTWNNSVTCDMKAGRWNHVTWEFSHANGGTQFVAVTVNGIKRYVNRTYPSQSNGAYFLHPTVQLDGNSSATDYSIWVDKLSIHAF